MVQVTIATFNVENLFTRFKFRQPKNATGSPTSPTGLVANTGPSMASDAAVEDLREALTKDGLTIERKNFERLLEDTRKITASAIRAVRADILCLQEVENLDTLRLFNSNYLKGGFRYPIQLALDGNDPRFIDLGLLSRHEVKTIRTHQFRKKGGRRIFSRDCLELELDVGGKPLSVFVNHLKSMIGGRAATRKRRADQCSEILKILDERFGPNFGNHDFVVLGDMNDFLVPGLEAESGIRDLMESQEMENVVARLAPADQWTHFFKRQKSFSQLDYIFVSRALAQRNPNAKPVIERRGQSKRINLPGKPPILADNAFFQGVTKDKKASDHCPVAITLTL